MITTPFHPGYLTRELMDTAKNLKVCVTAGVGSDHIDLNAAIERNIQVLEVTGSNVVSVAEHVVMSILLLVRNFVPAHEVCLTLQCRKCDLTRLRQMIERGDWYVSAIARNAYDLEGKVVGTIGAGRIGFRVLQRLVPFNCKELLYYDYTPLPELKSNIETETYVDLVHRCSEGDQRTPRRGSQGTSPTPRVNISF